MPNRRGIEVGGEQAPNVIGGPAAGAGNLISGNTEGVRIEGGEVGTVTVQGNRIGTAADGVTALGNTSFGVIIAMTNNLIGGTGAGEGNLIAFNGAGVIVSNRGQAGNGNAILRNSIYSNGGRGIDLGENGVTPNDKADIDTGANNLQNFPLLTGSAFANGSVSVSGTLNSAGNTTYRLEFFGNDAIDPSGFGEGQVFLGAADVQTDASGDAAFSFDFPIAKTSMRLTATATDPAGNTSEFSGGLGQLLNISTRLRVQSGDNVLIGGFIITGPNPKRVIVRGIGPSLSGTVEDFLADPVLELHDENGTLATNDDWKESDQAAIEATLIPPTKDLESAIVRTLPGGGAGYTAVLRGKDNSSGVAVVEAYDLDTSANSKLANISTRGLVATGNDVLIGGFIAGNGVTRVIVRALGPSLPVAGALADPTLELFDGNGSSLALNDSWRSSQEDEIAGTGIPPPDDAECAIVATLPPSAYTAVVRGAGGATGIALVEIYALN